MKNFSTSTLAKIGLLAAVSFLLMFFEVRLPVFPEFLALDFSLLPALVGALALGPMAGVCVELIKNLIDLTQTTSGGIGQLANFIMGSSFIVPVGLIYQRSRGVKGYAAGAAAGTALMIVAGCLANYFILIPMYTKFMPVDAIIGMAAEINPAVANMQTLILFCIAPFNLLKGIMLSVVGYVLYKALKPVLARAGSSPVGNVA